MKLTFLFFCMFLVIIVTFSSKHHKSKKNQKKMRAFNTNKHSVSIRQYPYSVGLILLYEKLPFLVCGGTIIAEFFAITGAHCLEPKSILHAIHLGKLVLRGGGTNIRGLTGIDHRIKGYSIHKAYNETKPYNDIALIQVKDAFTDIFETHITNAPENYNRTVGSKALAFGWGRVRFQGLKTRRLKAVGATLLQNCDNYYLPDLPGWFCAKAAFGSAVDYDFKGPLIQNNFVIGIPSWHNFGSTMYTIQVYTNVGFYNKWISENMVKVEVLVDS